MKTMVTGGGGFLAGHLIARLLREGHDVRTLELETVDLDKSIVSHVEIVRGSVCNQDTVEQACKKADIIFHTAAKVAPWGPQKHFWEVNVKGTNNVINACRRIGVKRLVHVSSSSVVFDGNDYFDINESKPYAKRFLNPYGRTKAEAEKRVLEANGADLEVVVIRPHNIWGPGDRTLFPRFIRRARSGHIFQVGDGRNLVSTLYVDNAVEALLLAAGAKRAAGNVYFVTDGVHVNLWDLLHKIIDHLDLPKPRFKIPYPAARVLAASLEAVWSIFRLHGEPYITRYIVAELAKNHTHSIERAREDIGYEPVVSVEEGLSRFLAWIDGTQI